MIAYLGIGLIPSLKTPRRRTQRPETLGGGPVRERKPIASIDLLTSQSTAFEHNCSATESGLLSLSLSLPPSLSLYSSSSMFDKSVTTIGYKFILLMTCMEIC